MSGISTEPQSPVRFHTSRPSDLRGRQPRWHRMSYIVRELPRALERLSRDLAVPAGGRVLDYGCADIPYRHFFADDVEFLPADLPGNPQATIEISPAGTVDGVGSATVDAILSTQVLEHVTDPDVYLAECVRVLRPGGRILLSTHGLMMYHPDPVDYWRWTCAGLREAVARAGLDVVRFEGIMGLAATGLQLVQEAWYYRLPVPLRPVLAFVLQSLAELADHLERPESRDLNSMVFALVARKP